jgi:hypothetical protein
MVSQIALSVMFSDLQFFHNSFTFANLHWLYQLNNSLWRVPHELCSESLRSFLYSPVTSSTWCPNFLLAVVYWKQETKVETINKNKGKITVLRVIFRPYVCNAERRKIYRIWRVWNKRRRVTFSTVKCFYKLMFQNIFFQKNEFIKNL